MVGAALSVPGDFVRRGLYISPYASSVGGLIFSSNTTVLGKFDTILDSTSKQQELLNHILWNGFNVVTFFDLHKVLTDVGRTLALRALIRQCRDNGVYLIEAVGGIPTTDYDRIALFQNDSSIPDYEKFDGVVTEIEFWWSNFSKITTVLEH
ncbi:MAG: hypothetical protein CUN57_00875, partial [Phototrophicales bacterium]